MDILKLMLAHDLLLVELYTLGALSNVADMKQSEANVYRYIWRLN